MPYNYDDQNIFAKILRGEIPCNKVLETEHSLAFHDINPAAPKHVLVIQKVRMSLMIISPKLLLARKLLISFERLGRSARS